MNYSKAMLIGRLTADPELRQKPDGDSAVNFSIAVNDNKDNVSFHNIQCFGELAQNLCKYAKKGKPLFVEGRLIQKKWERNGKQNNMHVITAQRIVFLDQKHNS